MVDDVSGVSRQSAEEAQNVSASAEEQTASVSQISMSAQQLSEQADQLRATLDAFEVNEGTRSSTRRSREEASIATDGNGFDWNL